MTLDEMKQQKKQLSLTNEEVARLSGVPFATVQKIFSNQTSSPRRTTLVALERAFSGKMPDNSARSACTPTASGRSFPDTGRIGEPAAEYSSPVRQSQDKSAGFTLEDYLALPEERRVELIDGAFYDMASPSLPHQLIAGQIYTQLLRLISAHQGNCVPVISPADVQLDGDDRTIVQPDVMVVCDRKKIRRDRIVGAPDLVIEILSKSTRAKDIILKSAKYQRAGVREYWMISPEKKQVNTLKFDADDVDSTFYTFLDKIPVGIFGGDCCIDFPEIDAAIKFLE